MVAAKFVCEPAVTGSELLFYSTEEGSRASVCAQQGLILNGTNINGFRPCGGGPSFTADQTRKMVFAPVVNDNIVNADGALRLPLSNRSGTMISVRNGTDFVLH